MTRDFTCKEHLFLLTEALEQWVWVFGIGMGAIIIALGFAFMRLRSDNASLHHLIRTLGGQG